MLKIEIDFEKITTEKEFYKIFKSKIELPEYFGDNLDALWDVMTAHVELPLKVRFLNFNDKKLDFFVSLNKYASSLAFFILGIPYTKAKYFF